MTYDLVAHLHQYSVEPLTYFPHRLFGMGGVGIHLIEGDPPRPRSNEIDTRADHLSFTVGALSIPLKTMLSPAWLKACGCSQHLLLILG